MNDDEKKSCMGTPQQWWYVTEKNADSCEQGHLRISEDEGKTKHYNEVDNLIYLSQFSVHFQLLSVALWKVNFSVFVWILNDYLVIQWGVGIVDYLATVGMKECATIWKDSNWDARIELKHIRALHEHL